MDASEFRIVLRTSWMDRTSGPRFIQDTAFVYDLEVICVDERNYKLSSEYKLSIKGDPRNIAFFRKELSMAHIPCTYMMNSI